MGVRDSARFRLMSMMRVEGRGGRMEKEEEAWSPTLASGFAEGRGSRWKDGKSKKSSSTVLGREYWSGYYSWNGVGMEHGKEDIIHSNEERILRGARGWQHGKEDAIRHIVGRILPVGMMLAWKS